MTRLQQELALQKRITKEQARLLQIYFMRLNGLDVELVRKIEGIRSAGYDPKGYEELLEQVRETKTIIKSAYETFKNKLNLDMDNARLDAFGLESE